MGSLQAPAPDASHSVAAKLEQLSRLHREGALSDDEFQSAKALLLTRANT